MQDAIGVGVAVTGHAGRAAWAVNVPPPSASMRRRLQALVLLLCCGLLPKVALGQLASPAVVPPMASAPSLPSPLRTSGFVLGGAAVLAYGGALAFYLDQRAQAERAQDHYEACGGNGACFATSPFAARYQRADARAERSAETITPLLIAGTVSGALAAVLLYLSLSRGHSPPPAVAGALGACTIQVEAGLRPKQIALTGTF